MVNIVKDLSVEHVLMFVIVAFLLYHLIGGCSCGMLRIRSRDGFNVGGIGKPVSCDYFNNNEDGCTNKNDYFKRYPKCTDECLANPYQQECSLCLRNPTCKWDSQSNTCFGPPPKSKNYFCNIKEHPGAVCHDDIDCVGNRTCGNPDIPGPGQSATCYGESNCPKI